MENEYFKTCDLLSKNGFMEKGAEILDIIDAYQFEIVADVDDWSWCYNHDYYDVVLLYSMIKDEFILYDVYSEDGPPISKLSGSNLTKTNVIRVLEDMVVFFG
jgi:hypothetical protein